MATVLNTYRLGLPISTPSRRCGFITSRVQPGVSSGMTSAALRVAQPCSTSASSLHSNVQSACCTHTSGGASCQNRVSLWLAGRNCVGTRPSAQIEGQKPVRRGSSGTEGLVLWRPVQQPQRVTLAAHAPQRGALLVAQSSLFDRVSRLSRAYVNYYSDAIVAAAEDPSIMLDQVVADMRADLLKLRRTLGEVLAARNLMQKRVDIAAADLATWTRRAEAAADAGAEDHMLRAAIRRRRASKDALDKLRVQLAQHEAAVKTLQGAMSAMQSKMEDARLQMPALKARWAAAKAKQALQGADGLSAFSGASEGAAAAFGRAEAKILAAELEGSISMDVDITADDALEQKFAALEDAGRELEELRRRASNL